MTALSLLLCVPVIMWTTQTVLLRFHGTPIRAAIDHGDMPSSIRTVARLVTQLSLLGVILVYPPIRGEPTLGYYASLFPLDRAPHFVQGLGASTLFLSLLFVVWVVTDQLQIDVHHSRRKWVRRLVLLIPTAVFGAFVEELLFRGVLLADMLRAMPHSQSLAIGIGTLVFAMAHYVRRAKRRWTFPGHLALGVLLCVAFIKTGSLWLSVGLHAGGILLIMGTRPFVRYRGPAWLIGASTFPFAGVVGLLGLVILTAFVVRRYG